jgi:hypothetical protein
MALSLGFYTACGDEESSPGSNAGASSGGRGGQSGGGKSGSGSLAGAGNVAGDAGQGEGGGASLGEAGASGEGGAASGEGEAGASGEGGAASGEAGASSGEAGAGGAPEICLGELANGVCGAAFARVQSAKRTAGTAAVSDVVKLAADSVSGNLLVLSVGVVWSGTNTTITVPSAFTLLHRRDNTVGTTQHESAALYLAEGAASLPAATGVTVAVGGADARLYLSLAEYAGFRSIGVADQVASEAGNGAASSGTTPQTTADDELWVMVVMSRGGGGHSLPTNGFTLLQTMATGAGTFSFSDQLVTTRGAATSGLTSSGDYAAIVATLRR